MKHQYCPNCKTRCNKLFFWDNDKYTCEECGYVKKKKKYPTKNEFIKEVFDKYNRNLISEDRVYELIRQRIKNIYVKK